MFLSFPLRLNLFLFPTFWYQLDGPSVETACHLHPMQLTFACIRQWTEREQKQGLTEKKVSVAYLRSTLRWPQPKLQTWLPPSHHMLWPYLAQKQILTSIPSLTLHSSLSPTLYFRSVVFSTQSSPLTSPLKAHNSLEGTFPKKTACPYQPHCHSPCHSPTMTGPANAIDVTSFPLSPSVRISHAT